MEWVKERDLLIAQTQAFVQSVANRKLGTRNLDSWKSDVRKPDVGKPDAWKPDAEPATKPRLEAAPIDATKFVEPPPRLPFSVPAPRISVSGDVRAEIQNRVASFRAHQQRFERERNEYCSATLARARVVVGDDSVPGPLRK
jgi:hypothetical protein